MQRCEREAWNVPTASAFSRGQSKFAGLYFAVVAVGAINASPSETPLLDHYCMYSPSPGRPAATARFSSLDFADFYFGLTKQAVGDIFETCSMESAQALLLMVCLYPMFWLGADVVVRVLPGCTSTA